MRLYLIKLWTVSTGCYAPGPAPCIDEWDHVLYRPKSLLVERGHEPAAFCRRQGLATASLAAGLVRTVAPLPSWPVVRHKPRPGPCCGLDPVGARKGPV